MSEYAAGHGMECRLLSLNDSPELHRLTVGNREFVFTGSARGKARFSATAARAARATGESGNSGTSVPCTRCAGDKFFARKAKSVVWTHGLEGLGAAFDFAASRAAQRRLGDCANQ